MGAVRNCHPTIITVQHTCANGWHEFICPQVPGFYLISEETDLETAYSEVPEGIAEIVSSDEGFPVTVKLQETYSEYLARLPEGFRPSMRHYSIEKQAA